MNTNKMMALIGNILLSLNNLLALILGFIGVLFLANFNNVNTSTVTRDGSLVTVTRGSIFVRSVDGVNSSFPLGDYAGLFIFFIILILLLILAVNIFTWLAFAKMEGPHGKGWRIFLLVIGILNIGTLFSGIFFILAFALKPKEKNLIENTSVSD